MPTAADLPLPAAPALEHSERVALAVRAAIAEGDGWIPFARYMELYAAVVANVDWNSAASA